MATTTRIVIQQAVNLDKNSLTAGKYPRFVVSLGSSITGVTINDLTNAIQETADNAAAAAASATAAKASQDAAKISENNALASQNAAKASETAAKTSETNAKTSETNAKNSETAAKTAQTAAELAETNAETAERNAAESARLAKISETNAANSASAAAISATNSFNSATQSATSATNSKNSADAAAASAAAADASATAAATSEDEAADHVVGAAAEADRAKSEADRAKSVVDAALDAEDIAGFYKSYKTKAEADADVVNRVVDEVVQVWNQTAAQYGWYKVIETDGVKSLQLVETENKLISVNNIKADTNGNVQVTIPGGNPSLWLGEVTLFPYRNTDTVGYSGILLADGRLLNRADYPDLWASISAGLIPSVSETEWQAGQNQFYSTGNGTTTFRLPNMLQGQALRSATAGETGTGAIKAQIPYITTVNGKAPDDTGAVELPYVATVNGNIIPDENGNLSLGNVVTKNVWDGTSGEVLLRGAFGLGGAGFALNEPDLVSFFKAMRGFGSGYYRSNTAIDGIPAYCAGFYSKVADTHSFICPEWSTGIVFVGAINDDMLDGDSPTVHTNILYGSANKPDLNTDTQGILDISKGGTGATTVSAAKKALEVSGVFCNDNPTGGAFNSFQSPTGVHALRLTNDGLWGVWKNGEETIAPLPISSGGTGATDTGAALNNLGLGYQHVPRFSGIDLSNYESLSYSGALRLNRLKESDQNVVTQGRIYHEVQSNLAKVTIHINNTLTGINRYIQFAETGDLTGLQDVHANNYYADNSVFAQGWIKGGEKIYIQQTAGGNREIHITVPAPNNDPGVSTWVNLMQGNWYSGYWQLGGIRGSGEDLECFRIGINNSGTDWKEFNFYNSYGGHISAGRGFRGHCVQGGWGIEWDYMGAPFYAHSVENNDGGWSPFVSGGTVSTGGYALRVGLGCISNGTAAWPDVALKLNGDGHFHRAFIFRQSGSIHTWGEDPWGGNYDVSMNPSSDRDIKKDINYDDGLASYENIKQFKPTTFIYKLDKYNRVRRGVIAQDLYQIDPEYVKLVPGSPIIETPEHDFYDEETENVEGKIIDYNDDTLALDINPIAIDTALAVRYLSIKFEESQEELKTVKAELAELKALVATLVNK